MRGFWQRQLASWLGEPAEVETIEQIRQWSESLVLRLAVRLADGPRYYYAKQAAGLSQELAVYRMASKLERFPAPAATVVQGADGRDWLLLAAVEGTRVAQSDPGTYRAAAMALAGFHGRAVAERWAERLSLPDLSSRWPRLAPQVLATVERQVEQGVWQQFDQQLLQQVKEVAVPRWQDRLELLASYPQGLLHGDCHSGNLRLVAEALVLIDWGSAACGPGLLDLVALLDVGQRMAEPVGPADEILAAYWQGLPSRLRQQYQDFRTAYRLMRCCRAWLELEWFCMTGEDYGQRADRELAILLEHA